MSSTNNRYLKFAKTNHWVPIIVFSFLSFTMVGVGSVVGTMSPVRTIAYFVGGLLFWTFIEYSLHRFSFHFLTEREPWKMITSGIHLVHHELPNQVEFIASPLVVSLPILLLLLGVLGLVSGSLTMASLIGAGIAAGYVLYEWVHYAVHHLPMKSRWGKALKRNHYLHHFRDSENYFGVTSAFWDMVFGTNPGFEASRETKMLPIFSRRRTVY